MTTAKSTLTGIEPIDRVRAYCEAVLAAVEVARRTCPRRAGDT